MELNMARRRGTRMSPTTPEQVVEVLRLAQKALDPLELAFAPATHPPGKLAHGTSEGALR